MLKRLRCSHEVYLNGNHDYVQYEGWRVDGDMGAPRLHWASFTCPALLSSRLALLWRLTAEHAG